MKFDDADQYCHRYRAILYSRLWLALLTYRELTLAVLLSRAENTTLPVVVWRIRLNGGFGPAAALTTII
jgi:ABC-type Fe3+ transport system permease subunit